MQVGKFWLITTSTLKGPWHVASLDMYWYIVNKDTSEARRIGRVKLRGTNNFDKARDEAKKLNGENNE